MYTVVVFAHLLVASIALGAIVATDLRLLSKFSQDKIRIAPPNAFVARIVMVALLLLWTTGGIVVRMNMQTQPDYLANPKLLAKITLVVLITANALVLHKITFPRLARGRRVARWTASDWIVVGVPVAASNALWMFVAFLGVARAWNDTMSMRDVFEIAAAIYLAAQLGVFVLFATAARRVEPERLRWPDRIARSLAVLGSLGVAAEAPAETSSRRARDEAGASASSRSRRSGSTRHGAARERATAGIAPSRQSAAGQSSVSQSSVSQSSVSQSSVSQSSVSQSPASQSPASQSPASQSPASQSPVSVPPTLAPRPPKQRPALRLVDTHGHAGDRPRERAGR